MRLSFSDFDTIPDAALARELKRLEKYRLDVDEVVASSNDKRSEYSLAHINNPSLHEAIEEVTKAHKNIKHLLLIGIGGSSLGVEAIHSVLDKGEVKLTVLDTLAANESKAAIEALSAYKKASDIAVCVVSKSGGTTETMVNASVVLAALKDKFGEAIYSSTIFIGDKGTEFEKQAKKLKVQFVSMPHVIGGRFSVATEVGLIPLALLKHDTDAFIDGVLASSDEDIEQVVAEGAARMYLYLQKNYKHYNFFAFEKRLASLGKWYRQLFAESIGKELDRAGKAVTKGMLPTISTPVELHSIGQLYLAGFSGVYTDFVTFDDELNDYKVPKQGLGKSWSRFSMQEVTTALYGGVVGAYVEKKLPHRTTIFEDERAYELGLFMAMRMRETMYIAELMNLNAFDQPNVELYKQKTKAILGI